METVKTVKEGVWTVEDSIALRSLNIEDGASIAAPEGKNLTMTVDGVGTPIKPGSYNGDIFITVTDSFFGPPSGLLRGSKPQEFRVGILIENGKYIPEKSVPAIVKHGEVTDKKAVDVSMSGCEESFNGIVINGDSEYTVEGLKIDFEGDGDNDFIGYGAGIACFGNSKVTVNNSEVKFKGVTRCALHAGGHSVTTLNNCRLINESPATDKMSPLWALGLSGTNRATQHCDHSTVYYNNCYLLSNGWGTLSVDGGIHVRVYVKESTVELKGPRARGYGAFSIDDCLISYDNSILNVQGYPLLMGGTGNKSKGEFTNGTIVNSTLYGVMIFRDSGCELKVNKGAVFNTASSTFVVKGANAYIHIDDAVLNPANSVILQLMDSDEPGMGPTRFIPPIGYDVEIPDRDLSVADPNEDVFVTVSNMEVNGDFYNSTTNLKANCVEKVPLPPLPDWEDGELIKDTEAQQGVKNLDIKFFNTRVNGVISAARAAYKDGVAVIDADNYKELSTVTQTAHEAVNNGVIVSFDKDCVWTVAGTSYLTSLTVADGCVIKAVEGKSLIMTVDGEEKEIAPGTYTGKIVLNVV